MNREQALETLKEMAFTATESYRQALETAISALSDYDKMQKISLDLAFENDELMNKSKWIPLIKRPMTDEEREYYREWSDIEGAMIFDCPLPEDGQEVLVSYGGYVCVDTFIKDDGCYFEGVDIDDVEAWMPKPEPYKAEKGGE